MFTIGADPEVCVGKGGEFRSAYGLVPGTKQDPHKVNKGAVQVDGLALEFNIDPASSYQEFQDNLDCVFNTLREMVPDYDFLQLSTVDLFPDYKATLPEESLVIGCDPDFNAYTEELNSPPSGDMPIRSAGGHVHIGGIFSESMTGKQRYERSVRLTRLMDKHVGVYSLLWDEDDRRRSIYGKAGACRLKDYGVEYRSLSNKWLFNPKLTQFVYEGTKKAVEALERGEDAGVVYQDIINSSNRSHPFFSTDETAKQLKEAA